MLVLFIWVIIILLALILTFPIRMTLRGGMYGESEELEVGIYIYAVKFFSRKKVLSELRSNGKKMPKGINADSILKSIECIKSIVSIVSIGFWSEDMEPHQVALMNAFCGLLPYNALYFGKGTLRITFDICLSFSLLQIIMDFSSILKAQKEGK